MMFAFDAILHIATSLWVMLGVGDSHGGAEASD